MFAAIMGCFSLQIIRLSREYVYCYHGMFFIADHQALSGVCLLLSWDVFHCGSSVSVGSMFAIIMGCFLLQIIGLCLEYVCYDPNYNYDEEEDEDVMDTEEEEEEGWVERKTKENTF